MLLVKYKRYRKLFTVSCALLQLPALPVAEAAPPPGCIGAFIENAKALPYSYSERQGGYCDGTVALENRATLQVVSFTVGGVDYQQNQKNLHIVAAVADLTQIRVLGWDKRLSANYRLDGLLPPQGLDVSLVLAIHPKGILAKNLGLFAWSGDGIERLYIPVIAGEQRNNPPTATLELRTPIALIAATYQICSVGACSAQKVLGEQKVEGDILSIPVPYGHGKTKLTVKVIILHAGNQQYGQDFAIMVQ